MRRQHHTKPDFTPLAEARLIVFFTRQLTRQTAKRKKKKLRFYFSNYCKSQSDMLFLPNKNI